MVDMVQAITTALAVLGAVLGVMNAWRNWVHDRVHVKVSANQALTSNDESGILVTVRNLSRFALTVTGARIRLPGKRGVILLPQYCDVYPHAFPVRLEPRTAMTVFIPFATLPRKEISGLGKVQVEMACGAVAYSRGISRHLRELALANK